MYKRQVNALGEHFGRDGLVSYIELGSLGHWGEWHVNISAGIQSLPEESVKMCIRDRSGDGTYIKRDYGLSIKEFYTNIWWPDMLDMAEEHGVKYTGVIIDLSLIHI